MFPDAEARLAIANRQWTMANTQTLRHAAARQTKKAKGSWQVPDGEWRIAEPMHELSGLGRFGANHHFLIEEVVLLFEGPGDAHLPEARGQARGVQALDALGVGGELKGAVHARR